LHSFPTRRSSDLRVRGMRVLVVGATGTIGKAVADVLAERGDDVIRASRHADTSVDVADPASIRAMYAAIGWVDAVVSCAGQVKMGPLLELTDGDFQLSIAS